MTNDHIFIASEAGLFIFDKQINKIYDLKSFGYKSKDFIFPSDHFNYTAITENNDNLYFANQSGIISFNLINRQWSNVVEPSIYGSLEVKSIVLNKENIFIATVNGLTQYDMINNSLEIFNYKFIGDINDMYIKGKKIWLGTSEGLISFQYK
jgi:ligand-binding sensor domain-containing protein